MLPALGNLDPKTLVPTGVKAGSKRKAGSELKTFPIVETSVLSTTLDVNGCAAVPLPNAGIDTETFVENVDQGTQNWFSARLQEALLPTVQVPVIKTKKNLDQTKMETWASGRDDWNGLTEQRKRGFFTTFDLRTQEGRDSLFITSKRKTVVNRFAQDAFDTRDTTRSTALAEYLDDRLRYVKQGDSRMGLSNMYKSWSQTGFGKWAHITPSQGLRAAMALREVLEENGIDTQLSGPPHMIYKPPGGKELPAHTDGPRPATTITMLKAFERANGRFPTTSEWMQDQGVQSLVHFDGGVVDGYTYAIGPMTPKKLYHCLKAVQDGKIEATDEELFPNATKKTDDGDEDDDEDQGEPAEASAPTVRERFLTGGTGPSFMKWKENIDKFNTVLEKNGEGPIGEIPLRPGGGQSAGAFVALWANGFPHGSAPNKARRITTTASLAVVGPNYKPRDERVADRVRALAVIASPYASREQRARARATITLQTEPFYGGKTHLHPEHAGTWFDPDMLASGTGGFYRSIAPTPEDAAAFAQAWKEGDPKYAPTAKDWRAYEDAKLSVPPGATVRRPKFRDPEEDAMEE
jgi:hypothetical protein